MDTSQISVWHFKVHSLKLNLYYSKIRVGFLGSASSLNNLHILRNVPLNCPCARNKCILFNSTLWQQTSLRLVFCSSPALTILVISCRNGDGKSICSIWKIIGVGYIPSGSRLWLFRGKMSPLNEVPRSTRLKSPGYFNMAPLILLTDRKIYGRSPQNDVIYVSFQHREPNAEPL